MRRISILRDIRHDRNGGTIPAALHRRGRTKLLFEDAGSRQAALRARESRVRSLVRINRDPCETACSASWLRLDQMKQSRCGLTRI